VSYHIDFDTMKKAAKYLHNNIDYLTENWPIESIAIRFVPESEMNED